jgi:hypothetical protein
MKYEILTINNSCADAYEILKAWRLILATKVGKTCLLN